MAVKRLPAVRVTGFRKAKPKLPSPLKPDISREDTNEMLTGMVNGMKASAPEERLARELDKSGTGYEFRYTIGAPRGLPGWKEVDFLVYGKVQVYAIEVDTAFTHRMKKRADVLHDAEVLKDLGKLGLQVYPQVFHLDGESELVDEKNTKNTVMRFA